jgi:hypothetical protein
MAKANRTLSQATIEKHRQAAIAKHHQAVMILARRAAINAIKARLKDQGVRVTLLMPKDINGPAYEYLVEHREELRAKAERIIATSPHFKAWRCSNVTSDAQTQNEPISTTSAVQISGVK